MKGSIFRAACLTLLVGAALSCVATESSDPKTEADFTATIPKGGLEKNVEKVFNLGPSSTLQVIDETGEAVYLPKPSVSADDSSSERYSVAYPYTNGACDFTQTIKFMDAFPGYTTPLWVRTQSDSEKPQPATSIGALMYTFTNPPAEYLGEGTTFCVRFKASLANSSQSTKPPAPSDVEDTGSSDNPGDNVTEDTTESPSQGTDGSASGPGSTHPENDAEEHEDGESLGQDQQGRMDKSSLGKEPPMLDQGNSSPATTGAGAHEKNESVSGVPAPGGPEDKSENETDSLTPSAEGTPSQTVDASKTEGSRLTGDGTTEMNHKRVIDGDGIGSHSYSRLRRLSDASSTNDVFLTIVVHSAAWEFSGGVSAASLAFVAVAATFTIC
ncbi:Toxoplasma gondii family A protein [Toxoplasma gondii ME49]|uniref:Toxoplasma gondii family A protein n=2 Tax=Toxoplasma gondii TaxID=5811 RepID=S8G1C5_TOXGM|nr:Toxoplasma gondii family A protein [Toxoplasma gondii ME49]EPT25325.1 Toxoplasma gondii family A protein [Toxoplasma gondii ME49]KFH09308.1 Toxoplasma gondii family A protein [Toxoplasma gondii VAND]|eukprot:XP_002370541.1 Toxoplasma gondii family A protein [Toxoplasma gondii ME49]